MWEGETKLILWAPSFCRRSISEASSSGGQGPGVAVLELLADLVVLAEHAAQVTAGKKDGSRTFVPERGGSSP